MAIKLIADSGSSKTVWCVVDGKKKKMITTQGISPYFLTSEQIRQILENELSPKISNTLPEEIYYYGTGCSNPCQCKVCKDGS
jgi:hypothetical protein